MPEPDVSALPGEWWLVSGEDAAELERQLAREVSQGHPLHGAEVQAVAIKRHRKDVVYWLPSKTQWAFVHLTGRHETDPRWPMVFLASQWEEIVAELVD